MSYALLNVLDMDDTRAIIVLTFSGSRSTLIHSTISFLDGFQFINLALHCLACGSSIKVIIPHIMAIMRTEIRRCMSTTFIHS